MTFDTLTRTIREKIISQFPEKIINNVCRSKGLLLLLLSGIKCQNMWHFIIPSLGVKQSQLLQSVLVEW